MKNHRGIREFSAFCAVVMAAGANAVATAAQFTYISPVPGSAYVSTRTNIILRSPGLIAAGGTIDNSFLSVKGAKSGTHAGSLTVSDDGETLVFIPAVPFAAGETVHVGTNQPLATNTYDEVAPVSFDFTTSATQLTSLQLQRILDQCGDGLPCISSGSNVTTSGRSYAALKGSTLPSDFPKMQISGTGPTAPGDIFICDFGWTSSIVAAPYLIILDNSGTPLFYRETATSCTDFKLQPNGHLTYFDRGTHIYIELDSSYNVVNTYGCGNGYAADLHELRILPNGHVVLFAYDPEVVDMSGIVEGGDSTATVTGLIIQELDLQKNVVFQWRSWDHFKITDATHENLTAPVIDYVHGNALDLDGDGNFLLSCRHMDEITKIDRSTGEIMWRMGGKNNQFTFLNDSIGYSHQHAVRHLDNGNLTIFDNGNFHSPQFSRAVEYRVDEQKKTSTLVWQFRNTPDNFAIAMGYVERLPNGNTLIGWGSSNPSVTEVTPDGKKVYELRLPDSVFSYRAYRFVWQPGTTSVAAEGVTSPLIPLKTELYQNYPNPFNPSTQISFRVGSTGHATLRVYNILGQEVATLADGTYESGKTHSVDFDASNLTSGVYFYQLKSGGEARTAKMLLVR